jgi:hypothetical protein
VSDTTKQPTPLPAAALAELSEAVAKMTPGYLTEVYRCPFDVRAEPDRACGFNGESLDASYDECHHVLSAADARAIVLLRNSAASLLAEVAASRERIVKLEDALYQAHTDLGADCGVTENECLCEFCMEYPRIKNERATPEPSHD